MSGNCIKQAPREEVKYVILLAVGETSKKDMSILDPLIRKRDQSQGEREPDYYIAAGNLVVSPDAIAKDERVKKQIELLRKKRKSNPESKT